MYFFNVQVILSFMIVYQCLGTDDVKDGPEVIGSDGSLWFGPRLGKRSLKMADEDNREKYLRLLEAAEAMKFYYDQLPYNSQADDPESRVTKKKIFTPILGRSLKNLYPEKRFDNVEFTPRLGRRLSDNIVMTPPEQDLYKLDPEKRRKFTQRLGSSLDYSPRLGRELAYDVYPENIRIARSANETKTT